jgi:hypothetical protein
MPLGPEAASNHLPWNDPDHVASLPGEFHLNRRLTESSNKAVSGTRFAPASAPRGFPALSWPGFLMPACSRRATGHSPAGPATISVNGIPHQNIIPVRKLAKIYSLPYQHDPTNPLDNVLIIGAGTGDDVANALHEGPSTSTPWRSIPSCISWARS